MQVKMNLVVRIAERTIGHMHDRCYKSCCLIGFKFVFELEM